MAPSERFEMAFSDMSQKSTRFSNANFCSSVMRPLYSKIFPHEAEMLRFYMFPFRPCDELTANPDPQHLRYAVFFHGYAVFSASKIDIVFDAKGKIGM